MSKELATKGLLLAVAGVAFATVPDVLFPLIGYDGVLADSIALSLIGGFLLLSASIVLVRLLLVKP